MIGLKIRLSDEKKFIIAIISQNTAAVTAVTVSYHLYYNICKIKLPNITTPCHQQHWASENILRVKDYYGFKMSSRLQCHHGVTEPSDQILASNIKRDHWRHHRTLGEIIRHIVRHSLEVWIHYRFCSPGQMIEFDVSEFC